MDRVTREDSRVKHGWGRCEMAGGGVPTVTILPLPQSGTLAQGVSRCPVGDRMLGRWSRWAQLCPATRDCGLHTRPRMLGATPPLPLLDAKIFWESLRI